MNNVFSGVPASLGRLRVREARPGGLRAGPAARPRSRAAFIIVIISLIIVIISSSSSSIIITIISSNSSSSSSSSTTTNNNDNFHTSNSHSNRNTGRQAAGAGRRDLAMSPPARRWLAQNTFNYINIA